MSNKIIRQKQKLNKIAVSLTNDKKKPKRKKAKPKKKKGKSLVDNWSSGMRAIGNMWK